MDNRKIIDALFKEKLFENEILPSEDIWSKIDNQLHPNSQISSKNKSRTYIKYSLIAFLLLSIPSAFYIFQSNKSERSKSAIADYSIDQNINPQIPSAKIEVEALIKKDHINEQHQSTINLNVYDETNIYKNSNEWNSGQFELNKPVVPEIFSEAPLNISEKIEEMEIINSIQEVAEIGNAFIPEKIEHQEVEVLNETTKVATELEFNSNFVSNDLSIPTDFIPSFTSNSISYNIDDYGKLKQPAFEEITLYSNPIQLKGMSIGVAASFMQTSIVESSNSFIENKPIQQSIKFTSIKGISLGYNFNNSIGIQVDYIYNSVLGQNYILQEEDQVVHKTLSLYYDQIPVVVKFKSAHLSELTNKPAVINYIAGVQYGILKDYRIPQEKRLSDPVTYYKPYDLSLIIGFDYDIYLSNRMFLSLGARSTMSNDISTHDSALDLYAKRNFTFGVRGSLNFMFRDY